MVAIESILTQLLNGIVLGSIYALVAMGLAIIFGLMGVVNFAHGAFYALGAYVAFQTISFFPTSGFYLALLTVPIAVGLFGMAIEPYIIRPLYDRNLIYSLLLTFGLMLVIHESIRLIWGVDPKSLGRPEILDFSVNLVIVNYPVYRLAVIVATAVIAASVWLFLQRTNLGMIIRAATENRDMVRALGIDIGTVYTFVFGLGVGIAGLGGLLHAPLVSVYPEMGVGVLVPSFVVVVIGGLNSFKGSVFAGLLVGVTSSLSFLIWPPMTQVVIFMLMAVFLIFRPQGMFGQEFGGVE